MTDFNFEAPKKVDQNADSLLDNNRFVYLMKMNVSVALVLDQIQEMSLISRESIKILKWPHALIV